MSLQMFYAKRRKSVVVFARRPCHQWWWWWCGRPWFCPTHNQDIPCTGDTDPSAKRKRIQPVVEVLQENYSEGDGDDDNVQPAVQAQRPRRSGGTQANHLAWTQPFLNTGTLLKACPPVLMSLSLSRDTAATHQMRLCALNCPSSMPNVRPASTAAGKATLWGQMWSARSTFAWRGSATASLGTMNKLLMVVCYAQ